MITSNLYYKKIGNGFPLIMLHGNGENHLNLLKLGEALSSYYMVYLLDASGHGKSPGAIHVTYDEMADDLLYFMKQQQIKSAHVFGYSDGAIVALKATVKSPEKFNKLILCGMNISPDGLLDETFDEMKSGYQKEKNPLLQLMIEGPHFDLSNLQKLNNQIQLYYGEYDLIKQKHQREIHDALKYSQLKVLKNETHGSYLMDNDQLKNDIIRFLKH